ncbi:unnamed protein product [Rhizophagus irregularis]|nr:unnamed protein product [Rhizophagus irregularis]
MFASNLLKCLVIMFFRFLILFHIYKNSPQLPSIKMFLIERLATEVIRFFYCQYDTAPKFIEERDLCE